MSNYTDRISPGDVIAVSDVHGCYYQFNQFLDWVRDSEARVIVCGDLIDRGPNDPEVLNRVHNLIQDPESWGLASFISLMGNHEAMFLNAIEGHGWSDWVNNGGDVENLELLEPHAEWLRKLPYYVTVGDTLFSHAGVFPGKDPQESMYSHAMREDFIWNRGPFLRVGPQFESWSKTLKKVVFGHTPKFEEGTGLPYRIPNGVCLDSGCFFSGALTAYNATTDTFMQFTNGDNCHNDNDAFPF